MAESVEETIVPSFFKVLIMQDFPTRLSIPPLFVETFGELLSEEILLETDSDNRWIVHVESANEGVYFQNGWDEFVEDNILKYEDFVTFKYVGNSTFKVNIYGPHCCEKQVQIVGDETTSDDEDN